MKKLVCLLVLVALVFGLKFTVAWAQNPSRDLEIFVLEAEKTNIDLRITIVDSAQFFTIALKDMPDLLANPRTAKTAAKFLANVRDMAEEKNARIVVCKEYPEIVSLLLDQLEKKPLPKMPTEAQSRVIKAGGKEANFSKMVDEAAAIIGEEKASLERRSGELKKEIDKLKAGKK